MAYVQAGRTHFFKFARENEVDKVRPPLSGEASREEPASHPSALWTRRCVAVAALLLVPCFSTGPPASARAAAC